MAGRRRRDLRWFLFFFRRSVAQRKGRVVIASLSVMLSVTIITGMIGITSGIREKLGSELKAYGANIIVSPSDTDRLPYEALEIILSIRDVEGASGQVLSSAVVDGHSFEVRGLKMDDIRDVGWRLSGALPDEDGEVAAGVNLKSALSLGEGASIEMRSGERVMQFTVSGFFEKGGPEDGAFIMPIPAAWRLAGRERTFDVVLVRGRSGAMDDVVAAIRAALPGAAVKTLRQVAVAEEVLLGKIQLLMALVTVVVLFAAAISVGSTMGANVLERREEIGLMKAMGATGNDISSFYLSEAGLTGILGGTAGFILGVLSAEMVSKAAFGSFVPVPVYLPVLSLVIGFIVSVVAGYIPVREAMRYDPAVILRGE